MSISKQPLGKRLPLWARGLIWAGYFVLVLAVVSSTPLVSCDLGKAQASQQEALTAFCPQAQDRIQSIPIAKHPKVYTAIAVTVDYAPPEEVGILISSNWDKSYADGSPMFPKDFKVSLLIHEYLHILQAESDINILQFYYEVFVWYYDPLWGIPSQDGYFPETNSIKHTLVWNIYSEAGQEYYATAPLGVEEFAYIGGAIAEGLGNQVPVGIRTYYDGILADTYLGVRLDD